MCHSVYVCVWENGIWYEAEKINHSNLVFPTDIMEVQHRGTIIISLLNKIHLGKWGEKDEIRMKGKEL